MRVLEGTKTTDSMSRVLTAQP